MRINIHSQLKRFFQGSIVLLLGFLLIQAGPVISQTYSVVEGHHWGPAIDIPVPALHDIDGDGLIDLLVGYDAGLIWHFEQEAAGSNHFVEISKNFCNINTKSEASPTFTDLDQDHLIDLIIGSNSGHLHHYEQDAVNSYSFSLVTERFNNIRPGACANPCFCDFDNDSCLNLVVGESLGKIFHYEQESVGSNSFRLLSKQYCNIKVSSYAAPVVCDINNDGQYDLLIGDDKGAIYHYVQHATDADSFVLQTSSFAPFHNSTRAHPNFIDIDQDGLKDLFVGEYFGRVVHYEQTSANSCDFSSVVDQDVLKNIDFGSKTGFVVKDIDQNGRLDLLIPEYRGLDSYLAHYQQQEVGSLDFVLVNSRFNDIQIEKFYYPTLVDIDHNGQMDLLISRSNGWIVHYEQDRTDPLRFKLRNHQLGDTLLTGREVQITLADLDGDGLLDLLAGQGPGNIEHYEQSALNDTMFVPVSKNFNNIKVEFYASPEITNLDGDTLVDLVVGNNDGNLNYYEQDPTDPYLFHLMEEKFAGVDVIRQATPKFADVNHDGLLDLFIADRFGGLHVFLREGGSTGIQFKSARKDFKLHQNFPNPFNPSTTISYQLNTPQPVELTIFNTLGQKVQTLVNQVQASGTYQVKFNAHGLSSGTYFYQLKLDTHEETRRMHLVR